MNIPDDLISIAKQISEQGDFFPTFEIYFNPELKFEIDITDSYEFFETHVGIEGAKEFLEGFLSYEKI